MPIILLACAVVQAQDTSPPDVSVASEELRQLLAAQSDHTALMQFLFSKPSGGFGATSKVAKLGERSREEMPDRIIISETGKPTVTIFPKTKEYIVRQPEQETKTEFAVTPAELAHRDDVTFKYLGMEKVGGYDCLKIEAIYQDARLRLMRIVFYAAPQLRNLVIKSELSLGLVRMETLLSEVGFNVSEKMFRVPAGYQKVLLQTLGERPQPKKAKWRPRN